MARARQTLRKRLMLTRDMSGSLQLSYDPCWIFYTTTTTTFNSAYYLVLALEVPIRRRDIILTWLGVIGHWTKIDELYSTDERWNPSIFGTVPGAPRAVPTAAARGSATFTWDLWDAQPLIIDERMFNLI